MPALIGVVSLVISGFSIVLILLMFGHREDAGYTSAQRMIRLLFRISRWIKAHAAGWDIYLVHARKARSERQRMVKQILNEPLPELSTPPRTKIKEFKANDFAA